MAFSGKNFPRYKVEVALNDVSALLRRSLTFCSIVPNPTDLCVPVKATLPISASLAVTRPVAAHPPCRSKSVKRNSFTQISAHFDVPSSPLGFAGSRFGLRTPIIIVRTLLKEGFPLTDKIFLPPSSFSEYKLVIFKDPPELSITVLRDNFKLTNLSNSRSILLTIGQIAYGSVAPHAVFFNGTSYS